jgi:Transmembrane domain of unknown function (DUF3566)
MFGIVHAGMSLLIIPFFLFAIAISAFVPHASNQTAPNISPAAMLGISIPLIILLPIFYGVMGFVFGIIGAVLYNLVARWIGGFEVEVEEVA